ncbi:Hypothetical protein CAP_8728 [Chondromyces apiculatus DSM 436]|uniref:Uncharacterized protein n=1 Tax=Chondromyces apiculatus DSM 436 TaxID=1192034 RepID=A0A017SXS2_9BACT|nr:Hypothetical protein CAP_8728 [Chondromyces apiculatus DSM 436]
MEPLLTDEDDAIAPWVVAVASVAPGWPVQPSGHARSGAGGRGR